jgi:hypothetical protein
LTRQCGAITRVGGRCTASVPPGADWCFNHDPARQDERRRNASKAARSKPGSREIKDLKKQLEDLAAGVLDETVKRANAAVVNQILNTRARLIELERKVKETEELEARLDALEQAQTPKGGNRRWG